MNGQPLAGKPVRGHDFPYYRPLWNRVVGLLLPPLGIIFTLVSGLLYFCGQLYLGFSAALLIYAAGLLLIVTCVWLTASFLLHQLEEKRSNIYLLNQQMVKVSRLAVSAKLSRDCLSRMRDLLANIDTAAAWAAQMDAGRESEALNENLAQIREQARSGQTAIGRFLELTRPPGESWLIRDLDIAEVLDDLTDIFADAFASRQIQVEKRYAKDTPVIRSNLSRIRQIFQNLFLAVVADTDSRQPGILRVETAKQPEGIEVAVSYPSLHFDENVFADLLDPLKAAQIREPGPWLALCAYTVSRVNGEIRASSSREHALTITVRLPWRLAGLKKAAG